MKVRRGVSLRGGQPGRHGAELSSGAAGIYRAGKALQAGGGLGGRAREEKRNSLFQALAQRETLRPLHRKSQGTAE